MAPRQCNPATSPGQHYSADWKEEPEEKKGEILLVCIWMRSGTATTCGVGFEGDHLDQQPNYEEEKEGNSLNSPNAARTHITATVNSGTVAT